MTEIQREIKRLYDLGIQSKNIAVLTKLKKNKVNSIIYRELELTGKYKKLKLHEVKEVKELREKGLKLREISEQTFLPLSRVRYILYFN